jgi:prepilin-type N-terminal cleavage/methylation domain-containing protein
MIAMATHLRRGSRAAGFTLLELMIGSTILLLLAGSVWETLHGMKQITIVGTVESHLQKQSEKALSSIFGDLQRSGRVQVAGTLFPYSFTEGDPDDQHDPDQWHGHVPAVKSGNPDLDADALPDQELLFLLPADGNADGIPDVDPLQGELIWDSDTVSYSVRTLADGSNVLMRKVGAGVPVVVARDVERCEF